MGLEAAVGEVPPCGQGDGVDLGGLAGRERWVEGMVTFWRRWVSSWGVRKLGM